ncbi:MAG: alcohol dehydrogenase catalytic domain-containing protein [Chloroflexota bacterium]
MTTASSATMRAIRFHGNLDVRLDTVPVPRAPGEGEVRVGVAWTGVCGTDREEWRHGPLFVPAAAPHPLTGRVAPITMGHEIAGHVLEVGRGVTTLSVGQLVAIDPNLSCGTCWWCVRHEVGLCRSFGSLGWSEDGGLAEQVVAQARYCIAVDPSVDPATAALAEPVSVAVRAARRGRLRLGESVLVLGGGMIGVAALVVARAAGAGPVIVADPLAGRRDLALTLGADLALDPTDPGFGDAVHAATGGRGADLTFEAAGVPGSAAAALAVTRSGGRCVIVGLSARPTEIDTFTMAARELELIGTMAHVWDEDLAGAVRLLERGALRADQVVAARVALEDTVELGFSSVGRTDLPGVKVLVSPSLPPAARG